MIAAFSARNLASIILGGGRLAAAVIKRLNQPTFASKSPATAKRMPADTLT